MIKKLLHSVREYKKASLLAPLFVIAEVALEVTIPVLIAALIDKGIEIGKMDNVLKIGGLLVVCCAFSILFGALSGKYAAIAGAGFAKNLRHDAYYQIQDFSFSNIDKFSTASLVTRLTTDVNNIQNAYMMVIRIAVRAPIMLVFAFFMSFRIHSELSLVFLAAIPFLGIGLYLIASRAHPYFKRVFKTYDKLNEVVEENLQGIRVVKSYVREEHEIGKFRKISQKIYEDFTKATKLVAMNGPLMQFAVYACMIAISYLGAKIIVLSNGVEMSTGQLTSLFSYETQMLMSMMMLSFVLITVVISRASIERVVEILNEKSDITNCENPVMSVEDGSVQFKNVSFSYANDINKLCLSDINLNIKSGQTVGIIGGTGSSKSTLVQLISRLYDTTCGEVLVGGVNVRDYDIETLRDSVATVLQKNELFSGTIKENLRWGNPNASDDELIEACKLACADEFISAMPDGYDTYIEQGGTNVSGGQKQRLCIARALLKKPNILILDDSTSAVDTKTDSQIRSAFLQYIPETTKFIIAQRIASVEASDVIVVLDGGRINSVGTHEQLMQNNEIYQEVYNSQSKGGDFDD